MFLENQRMFLPRLGGELEETFFTFSHSPVRDESGGIGAVTDAADVARQTIEILAVLDFDLPFLLYYALDETSGTYRLVAHHGIEAGRAATSLAVEPDATGPWPFAKAMSTSRVTVVDDLVAILRGERCGPYEEPPNCAFMIPANVPSAERTPAVLIAGVSSRLRMTDAHGDFYHLLGVTISAALSTMRAWED